MVALRSRFVRFQAGADVRPSRDAATHQIQLSPELATAFTASGYTLSEAFAALDLYAGGLTLALAGASKLLHQARLLDPGEKTPAIWRKATQFSAQYSRVRARKGPCVQISRFRLPHLGIQLIPARGAGLRVQVNGGRGDVGMT